jgi:hypothetical protein
MLVQDILLFELFQIVDDLRIIKWLSLDARQGVQGSPCGTGSKGWTASVTSRVSLHFALEGDHGDNDRQVEAD